MAGFEHLLKSYDVSDLLDDIASADPPSYLRRCFAEGCSTPSLSWPRVQQLALCAMVLDSIVNDRDYDVFEPELIADWRAALRTRLCAREGHRGAGIAPGARHPASPRPRRGGGAGRTRAPPGARVDALAPRVRLRGRGGLGRLRHTLRAAACAAARRRRRAAARLLRLASADHHSVRHFAAGNSARPARGAACSTMRSSRPAAARKGIALRSAALRRRNGPDELRMSTFCASSTTAWIASKRRCACPRTAPRCSPPRAHSGSSVPRRPRHPPTGARDTTARSASARASAPARARSGGRRAGAIGAHAVDQRIQCRSLTHEQRF